MYSLVYVSSATQAFTPHELRTLLDKSRQNNEKQHITGLLLYKDGNIMQLLEGEKDAVQALYARIALDSRHRGASILFSSETEQRAFADWSMAFRDLKDPAIQKLPGFSALLNETSEKPIFQNPSRAQRLIEYFRSSMR